MCTDTLNNYLFPSTGASPPVNDITLQLAQLLDLGPFSWTAISACAFNGLLIGIERQTRGNKNLYFNYFRYLFFLSYGYVFIC